MALRKSSVLLPEVFQTTKNKKFLGATVDQLISEPNLQRVNSYIGRKFAPNFKVGDSYVQEINDDRQNYQLEPAVVYRTANGKVETVNGYIDFVNNLKYNGVNTVAHSDLFTQEYYTYSGFVNLDMLVNYGEYFWMPGGPDSVQVFNSVVDTENDFTVTRSDSNGTYSIDNSDNANPIIRLARGGYYTFNVQQTGHPFWIQTERGNTGTSFYGSNISTRQIEGVVNNGEDNGVITFSVPQKDAQNDEINAVVAANPDFATDLTYRQVHNIPLATLIAQHGGIDKQTEIHDKSLVFVNDSADERDWDQGQLFDAYGFDDPNNPWDETTSLDLASRYEVYKILVNNINGVDTVQLIFMTSWAVGQKVKIKQGDKYGNREFLKAATGIPKLIEPYTAGLDVLYYQDGTNNDQWGKIILVEQDTIGAIDVEEEILGNPNYTSANGVVFTNGLKVQFNSDVTPSQYANKDFIVEGIGQPQGIVLVPFEELVTPETYTVSSSDGFDTKAYDIGGWAGTTNAPTEQDYIVINRSSSDRNAWSRGNRWFHREVIEATAKYNSFTVDLDDTARAKRPIIEFYSGLELFNMGTTGVAPVTVIDTTQTDALSNVNGTTGYYPDGVGLQQDSTIIFTADLDPAVRNKVYRVDFINEDSNASTDTIINLVEIATVVDGNSVLSKIGVNNQGKQFWLDNGVWRAAQQKTKLNQEPLFNVFDPDHTSFGDTTKYPSSTFTGNKLFSYKRNNNATPDSILGFGVTYQNFSQIGDIVFENNFDKDTFQYTKTDGNINVIIRSGHVHQFDLNNNRTLYNGWTKVLEPSTQYQIVSHTVGTELYSFEIGASVKITNQRQPLQVFVNGNFKYPSQYTHVVQAGREYVVFNSALTELDVVTIKFYSDEKAENSFYEVPTNLENNANNDVFETLTLGQLRNHTVKLSQQIKNLVGVSPGKSNIRDLNYRSYPGNILQHSAGLTLPTYLLSHNSVGLIDSINYVKNEYTKFKNRFLENIDKLELDLNDPSKCVDDILSHMSGKKSSVFPFYYSDMLPWGEQKTQVQYTIDDASESEFEFATQFDLTSISNRGVLVYHNDLLLVEGVDYTFDTVEAKVTLTTNAVGLSNIGISVNDTITIVEYTNTDGSFVPPTPTKLGLFNKYHPRKYTDNTYATPKTVVQGHDGSIWVGWGDIRDDIVLEYEKRVYNNIKTAYRMDLFDFAQVIPGYFRSTLAQFGESNNIIRSYFGEWALRNKVKVAPNTDVDADNPFTWNYRNSVNKLNKQRIPGFWRAIYKWFYDTDTPHTTPWEMLGLGTKPVWWDIRYGVAPYTSGNTVLWEHLRDGKLFSDAIGEEYTVLANRVRPNLMDIIPVDEQGNLRSPNDFLAEDATSANTSENWVFTDGSPAETAWRRSSELPYIMQILAALLKPAQYGSLLFDTNLYVRDSVYDQVLQTGKSYRPQLADLKMHGQTNGNTIHRVEGYNQFISEFVRFNSYSIDDTINKINNLDINLCYPLAGWTDKKQIKVVAESVTPSSQSENIFIPDENLTVFAKKSLPIERVVYSGVQVIKRQDGFEIQGYDVENPYFKIIPSVQTQQPNQVTVGATVLFEYKDFERRVVNIPYGTIVQSRQQVFDFLVAYQRYLLSRGFVFDGTTGVGDRNDFVSAGKEFAFWTDQNWPNGSVIVLSPYHSNLTLNRAFATVDDLKAGGALKDANGGIINPKFYDVSRSDNIVEIKIDTSNTQLYSAKLDPVQHEHVIVFDNKTIFNDIIYQPELGNRHERLKLVGAKSGDWNGTMHAPGFFINEDSVDIWSQYTDYKKGDLVSYQDKTYVAKGEVTGKNVFDYNEWTLADNMSTGMVKNLSNKAGQFQQFFEMDSLNLEDGVDKLGKGIIGFNSKSYLEGLGLDDVSQVKFYQGMLRQKGTGSAINKLIDAELTNLNQEIDYYEEWAFRVGEYGSVDSNQVIEAVIPEDQATNNPFVVHYHSNGDVPSDLQLGHYHIQAKDLYKTPNNYTGEVFAYRSSTSETLNDLDSAGYARLDDVDFTVFHADQLPLLSSQLGALGKGKKIWIATDATNTWGMRRVDETLSTVISVVSTSNGYLVYTTDRNHGLVEDDYVIVRAARPIGRVARIHSVPNPNEFVIEDASVEAELLDVKLPMYKLSSVRFSQPSDISSFSPVSGWNNKELVWVDNNNSGKWEVLQNTRPWTTTGVKTQSVTANAQHGYSISINSSSTMAVVGTPSHSTGFITPYVRSEGTALSENTTVTAKTIGTSVDSFGASVAAGNDYVAVGAPDTESQKGAVFIYYVDSQGVFNSRPVLRPSGLSASDQFGFSTVFSGNNRYLFVGAKGNSKVYIYTLIDLPTVLERSYTFNTDGSATYTLDFTPENINSLNVADENGNTYLPYKDFTLSGADITFTATPSAGLDIIVRQQDYWKELGTLTQGSGEFGYSIDVDYTGETLVVGDPSATVSLMANSGEVYVYKQIVQKFAMNGISNTVTTDEALSDKIYVTVNGVLQIETDNPDIPTDNDGSTEGYYTRAGNTVTFKYTPSAGTIVEVATGTYVLQQTINQTTANDSTVGEEQFGISVAVDSKGTVIAVGAPGEDEVNPNTGSAFIFQDAGRNYASVTSTQGTGTYSQTSGHTIYVDGYLVTVSDTSSDAQDLADDINAADIPGVSASVNSAGNLVVASTNTEQYRKLTLVGGTSSTFATGAGVDTYKFTQKINHPNSFENENFGQTVAFDKHVHTGFDVNPDTRNLVIASDRASTLLAVGFDVDDNSNSETYLEATTSFDANGTTFTDRQTQSGAAYVYELLDSNAPTITNPSKMVYGQQLKSTNIEGLDQFGAAVAYSDSRIFIGAPQDTATHTRSGSVYEFNNTARTSAWAVYRSESDRIDTSQINRVALYNKKSGQVSVFLDYIDPAKGKIAGVAQAELSYITHSDPALYNDNLWSYRQKHRLWWDTSTVHYLNAEQGNIDFRTNYWGTAFPGSSIDVYEWIESEVPPGEYSGEGTVKDVNSFTVANVYDSVNNSTAVRYYFWVKGLTQVPVEAEFRTMSADSVTSIITDPKATGVPYVAFLQNNTIALYNCKQYFADKDVVLSVNYDVVKNEGILHSEFELYGRGNTDQNIPQRMYTKLVDSLAGADSVGNPVPDPFLSEVEKYGVLTRPRQGLFVNRSSALKVLVQYCNDVFKLAPFARNNSLTKLLSSEPIPTVNSGEYNTVVDNIEERDFINTLILPTGHKVLVLEDETKGGYWTIYSLTASDNWALVNIQGYNTEDYWSYETYYADGYDSTTVPKYQVTLEADLLRLTTAQTGDIAKVTSNDEGNYSMFVKTDTDWAEVIIERGTIKLDDSLYAFDILNSAYESTGFDNSGFDFGSFDKVPSTEIRQILDALKTDMFVGVYEIHMNELFFRLMEYALNETDFTQDWMFKTSFISVAHKLRSLEQYSTFKFDNTQFIEDFINEVKPYKTKIREYVSKYDKVDNFQGDVTDFDVHSYYDEDLLYFRKPSGEITGDDVLQQSGLNKPWSDHYGYKVNEIVIVNAGTGFIDDPVITISAPQLAGGVQATAVAKSNGDNIISITMINKGSGYTADPTVTIDGAGTEARVSLRLVNTTTRSLDTTLKFDRITYTTDVKDWAANTSYTAGDVVAYQNTQTKSQEVYNVTQNFTSASTFSVEDASGATVMTVKLDETFTNAADRIAGYYYPKQGMIGDSLNLLMNGIDYPMNKVTGPSFDQEPGFDQATFDTVGFDALEVDSDGLTVLSDLDTVFSGVQFGLQGYGGEDFVAPGYLPYGYTLNIELGLAPESIAVDGAGFVDTYNSHAPEELVPGRVYDTLDMEVYTHVTWDREYDGNAPKVDYTSFTDFSGTQLTFVYGNAVKRADDYDRLVVYKNTERLYNFTVDYSDRSITLPSALTASDILHVYAYGMTGENMSGDFVFDGDGSKQSFVLSTQPSLAKQTLVYVDGVESNPLIGEQDGRAVMTFTAAPAVGAHIHAFTFEQDTSRTAPNKIEVQTVNMTSGTYTYALDTTVEYAQPFSGNVVVEIDGVRLRPANSVYYTADGSSIQYEIPKTAGETTILQQNDIGVTVISATTGIATNLVRNVDYIAAVGNDYISLNSYSSAQQGDTVIVYTSQDAEYRISGNGQEITIDGGYSFTSSSVMRITTFANHDPLRIQTKVHVGQGTGSTTIIDEFDSIGFDASSFDRSSVVGTIGTYALDRTVTNVNNFWVNVDGRRLHPGDYITNGSSILMSNQTQATITGTTVIVISHISENQIQPSTGFRIFKDMNDNIEYLRLCRDATTETTVDTLPTDTKIYVADASVLPQVTTDSEYPGVVFIGNERVTYWEINTTENYITNLRRGTQGTQIYSLITPGFLVVDGGRDQYLPALDSHTKTWYDLGTGTAADGQGLQQSSTTNANFLKACMAVVPTYKSELNEPEFVVVDYVDPDYVEGTE